jgi:hypothetical protein
MLRQGSAGCRVANREAGTALGQAHDLPGSRHAAYLGDGDVGLAELDKLRHPFLQAPIRSPARLLVPG